MKKPISDRFMRCFSAFLLTMVLSLIAGGMAQAETSLKLDASLGSMVGAVDQPEGGQVPFWGELYGSTHVVLVDVIGGVGHRSNADRNGNEMDGEYYFVGIEKALGKLYGKATVSKFFQGDVPESDTVMSFEWGFQQDNFRFTAFLQKSNPEGLVKYTVHGLKFGYTFNLL